MSKPREIAHLLKNKFGSADNITALTSKLPSRDAGRVLPTSHFIARGGEGRYRVTAHFIGHRTVPRTVGTSTGAVHKVQLRYTGSCEKCTAGNHKS